MKSASESAGAGSAMVVDWVVVVVSKMLTDDVVEGEEGGGEPSSTGLTLQATTHFSMGKICMETCHVFPMCFS